MKTIARIIMVITLPIHYPYVLVKAYLYARRMGDKRRGALGFMGKIAREYPVECATGEIFDY